MSKIIHAVDVNDETYCGIYREKVKWLDTRTTGNINRITCKRCLAIAFKA